MTEQQTIDLINEVFEESGDHEMDSPFISELTYDGSLEYIQLAIQKAARLAFEQANEYDSFEEFIKMNFKPENE